MIYKRYGCADSFISAVLDRMIAARSSRRAAIGLLYHAETIV